MRALIVVPTYDRVEYLGRVVQSFIEQTYDEVELLIINDQKNLSIECDVPNVRIMNISEKILLPHKRNLGVQFGYHDIIFTLDDDCIMLPNYIKSHMEIYKKSKHVEFIRDKNMHSLYCEKLCPNQQALGNWSFRRSLWFDVGGYALDCNNGEDQEFQNKIDPNKILLRDSDIPSFVYGWTGVNYHCSATDEYRSSGQEVYTDPTVKKIIPDVESYTNLQIAHNAEINGDSYNIFDIEGNICLTDK